MCACVFLGGRALVHRHALVALRKSADLACPGTVVIALLKAMTSALIIIASGTTAATAFALGRPGHCTSTAPGTAPSVSTSRTAAPILATSAECGEGALSNHRCRLRIRSVAEGTASTDTAVVAVLLDRVIAQNLMLLSFT